MEDKIRSWAVVLVSVLALQGCAGLYSKDTAYDPDFPRETLFDQIPNNTGGALHRCAGHLPESQREPHQTGRC